MASASIKTPPSYIESEMDYEQWKKDIELWSCFTDLPKAKQGIAVHLSLSGRARKASSEIEVNELKSDDGLKLLLIRLDRVFLQDANWKCFNTYLAFENYHRAKNCSIDEYLSEFDLRHYKLKECGVNLPDAVVACRLLKSCGLSDMHFQLALSTTTQMTFENMRSTLKKLFAESGHLLNDKSGLNSDVIKVEKVESDVADAFYGNHNRGRGWQQHDMRGRRPYKGKNTVSTNSKYGSSSDSFKYSDDRFNPRNEDGSISVCAICNSKMHWARNCPHAHERKSSSVLYNDDQIDEYDEEIQITLLANEHGYSDGKIDNLLGETIGYVLLDSGCSKTVCGEYWLKCFMDTLTDDERRLLKTENSRSVYRFGDGRRVNASKCITIPCVLADNKVLIKTDVVPNNIPLLLSKYSMKKAEMVLDLKHDSVTVFNKKVPLSTTTLGHYTLPIYRMPDVQNISCILLNSVGVVN